MPLSRRAFLVALLGGRVVAKPDDWARALDVIRRVAAPIQGVGRLPTRVLRRGQFPTPDRLR